MKNAQRLSCTLFVLALFGAALTGCRGRDTPRRQRAGPSAQARAAAPAGTAPTLTPSATNPIPTDTLPTPTSQPEPDMASCRQWLASSASLQTPIACADWDFFRKKFLQFGGGAFPVGEGRYYLVWFPKGWETLDERKVIVSLHGTGGCAEWMINHWYQTSGDSYPWVLIALQYYDRESKTYDEDETIYRNLTTLLDEVAAHCPIQGSQIFYHGFSRGSAQSFALAIRDRAERQMFSAFIADSGCAGLNHPTLSDQPPDALAGARFWMWCGENDVSTVDPSRMTCDVMEQDMRPYVEEHGGQVDVLIREPDSGHGMFDGCKEEGDTNCTPRTAKNLGPSLPLLFEYIANFSP